MYCDVHYMSIVYDDISFVYLRIIGLDFRVCNDDVIDMHCLSFYFLQH